MAAAVAVAVAEAEAEAAVEAVAEAFQCWTRHEKVVAEGGHQSGSLNTATERAQLDMHTRVRVSRHVQPHTPTG